MKHHLRRLIIIGILLAIGAGLGWYWSQPKPVVVRLQAVERGSVQSSVANTRAGTVKACRRTRVTPAIGGLITNLPAKDGATVKKGDLLLELWNRDLVAQVELAKREARANRARAVEACVVADVARSEANRMLRLREQKIASEEVTERAVGDAKAKEAACKAAKSANLVADARTQVARATLERTVMRAPFDGTIAEVNGELGEFVTPSPPGIATLPVVDLIDTTCLTISAPIDEVDAPSVKPGLSARITLDAFPGETFDGRVRRIAPYVMEIEKQARTVDIEAEFTNPADYVRLLPGYSADVEIILETRENVLHIPTEALLENQRVLVFDPDSEQLQSRKVETGLSNWKLTEITSGLKEGERVVLSVDRKGVEPGALATPE